MGSERGAGSSPHDALFKAVFSRRRNALALLRAGVPRSVLTAMDARTLRVEPASFVDAELASTHRDLLFSVRLRGGRGQLLLYVIEHQSTVDRLMPLRVLRYVLRVWEWWRRERDEAENLPPVVPVVLYQGPGTWDGPRRLGELLEAPPKVLDALGPRLAELALEVVDLGELGEGEVASLPGPPLVRIALTALRHLRGEDTDPLELVDLLADELAALLAERHGAYWLRVVVQYHLSVRRGLDAQALIRRIRAVVGPEGGEVAMKAAKGSLDETFRQGVEQGIRQGVEQGIQRGVEQGVEQGRRDALCVLLEARFGALDAQTRDRIAGATLAELERWTRRAGTADRIADVFV